MSRSARLYFEDIITCCDRVAGYTTGMTLQTFAADERTVDAVIRNLEVIGEAVKNVPEELRQIERDTPWRQIAGMRDVLAHAYFGVDIDLVWDVITNHLRPLREAAQRLLAESSEQ